MQRWMLFWMPFLMRFFLNWIEPLAAGGKVKTLSGLPQWQPPCPEQVQTHLPPLNGTAGTSSDTLTAPKWHRGNKFRHVRRPPNGMETEEKRREWASAASDWQEAKFNLYDCFVKYSRNMLVLWGLAGMSERRERSVAGQNSFFL